MSLEEFENAVIVVKWVYPIVSSGFIVIFSLFIYIWKTNIKINKETQIRQDVILEELVEAVQELKQMNSANKERFRNNEGRIKRNEDDIQKLYK